MQNRICHFVFDLLVYQNRDLMRLSLIERREIVKKTYTNSSPRIRIAEYFETSAEAMLESAAEQEVDGVVANVAYYRGSDLVYVSRVRNGFVPATRRKVFVKLQVLVVPACPFVNLPEADKGRWGTDETWK